MEEFWLGAHKVSWLRDAGVPLMLSRRVLEGRRKWPRAAARWVLDSGAFTEIVLKGGFDGLAPYNYIALIRRANWEIGELAWAAPQDWMCEEVALRATGLTVKDHQTRTVDNYLQLTNLAPELPIIPVLQGWSADDYMRCWGMYEARGVHLEDCKLVGVGSVCRRQSSQLVRQLVNSLSSLPLHLFGVKTRGLKAYTSSIVSADSHAWSVEAYRTKLIMPGCTHASCHNCIKYALYWRERLLLGLG